MRDRLPLAAACIVGAAPGLMVLGRGALQGAMAVGLLLTLAALAGTPWRRHLHETRAVMAGLAVIFLAALPGVIVTSQDPATSAATWARTAMFLAGGLPFYLFFRERPDLLGLGIRSLLVVATPTFVVAAAFCLVLYVQPDLTFVHEGLPGRQFMRLKPAASSFACLAPLVAWAVWKLEGRWRWLAAALLLAGLILVWRTGSKATLAGLLVAGGTATLIEAHRRRLWHWVIPAMAGIVAVAALWLIRRQRVYETDVPSYVPDWIVDPHRQNIWRFTFERFLEKPWLGWGINTINTVPGAKDHVPGLTAEFIPSHPHSWLVEVLSETGLVGTVPLLLVIALMLFRLTRAAVRHGDAAAMAFLALMLAYLSSGLFNFSLWAPWWMLSMVGSAALLGALARGGITPGK